MKRTFLVPLTVMGILVSVCAEAAAAEATLFLGRLNGANFYETGQPPREALPVDRLFAQARSFRYVADGRADVWQSPDKTAAVGQGDCEDKAIWLASELRRHGYREVRLVIGKRRFSNRGLHAWVELRDPSGEAWLLDPTEHRRPWKTTAFGKNAYRPVRSFDA